jgi:hypothetical protein
MTLRRVSFAVVVIFLMLGTVGFGESQRRTEIYRFNVGPVDGPVADCGDFIVNNTYSGLDRFVLRFDKNGDLAGIVEHILCIDSVLCNGSDPSLSVQSSERMTNLRLVVRDGIVYISGQGYRTMLPGGQGVVGWIGHWQFDLATGEVEMLGGPNDFLGLEGEDLCHALRPHQSPGMQLL